MHVSGKTLQLFFFLKEEVMLPKLELYAQWTGATHALLPKDRHPPNQKILAPTFPSALPFYFSAPFLLG